MSGTEFTPDDFQGHEALIAELRAGTLDAPSHLQRRILADAPAKRRRLRDMSARRRGLLVIPIAASLAVGAALVHGVLTSGSQTTKGAAAPTPGSVQLHTPTDHRGPAGPQSGTGSGGITGTAWHTENSPNSTRHAYYDLFSTAKAAAVSGNPLSVQGSQPVTIAKNRHVHATATLKVVVPDRNALSSATNKATAIVTSFGGYAQHVQYSKGRNGGSATLNLRVPVGEAQLAIQKLSALGHLVSQQITTKDLEQKFSKQTDIVATLRRAIKIYDQALQSGSLTGSQRVEVEIRRANAEHFLTETRRARGKTLASAATSDINLTLSTNQHAFAAPAGKSGRLGRLLHNAAGFLALEGVIVLYALIVAGPIVLLLALAWWLSRERRRRDERLLASA
jgi:hypothetical protein